MVIKKKVTTGSVKEWNKGYDEGCKHGYEKGHEDGWNDCKESFECMEPEAEPVEETPALPKMAFVYSDAPKPELSSRWFSAFDMFFAVMTIYFLIKLAYFLYWGGDVITHNFIGDSDWATCLDHLER